MSKVTDFSKCGPCKFIGRSEFTYPCSSCRDYDKFSEADVDVAKIQALIPIKPVAIGENLQDSVNARELHAFLESKQDFSTWIKHRIEQYGFRQGVDFTSFHKIVERETGSTTRIEYHLSMDMAKEISMVERNHKGKEARL